MTSRVFFVGWGARHTFSLLAFLSLLVNFSLRVNISVVIVAMVSSGEILFLPLILVNNLEKLGIWPK